VTDQTRAPASSPCRRDRGAAVRARPGQAQTVLGLMIAVAILDQTTKYWGWRHVPRAVINPGSTWLIGAPLSGLYSGAMTGPIMDLVSCGLLGLAVVALLRRRRSAVVLVSGALVIGGWSSNLLDRLGMHLVNAPGSARGPIDFIGIGGHFYNIADVVILGSTVAFLAACRTRSRRAAAPEASPGGLRARELLPSARAVMTRVGAAAVDL
jgi:lipoprotein signal peptidase